MTDRSQGRGDVLGRRFPSVAGKALSGELVRFPEDVLGSPTVLFVAYRRNTQRDIDQWAAFVRREAPEVKAYELPVIPALIWRPLQGWIDSGMRGGVPNGQWANVVTLYEQGAAARDFVGDRGGLTANVLLLDATGVVCWSWHDGFGDPAGQRLLAALASLA
jgi:hypothetical protein